MSLSAVVRALVASGATGETILAVVEAHEAEQEAKAAKRREKDAARKRAERDRVRVTPRDSAGLHGTPRDSAGLHGTPRDSTDSAGPSRTEDAPACERARVRDISPRLVIPGLVGGVGVASERAPQTDDWPKGNGPHLAKLLVEAAGSPWLDPAKSPDLTTTVGRLAAWKRDGASWEHDVLPVVTGLCANRRSRISSWKFFDAAIARSIADNRAALEIPESGGVIPLRPGGGSLTDRIAAEHAEARRKAFEMLDAQDGRTN